MTSRAKESQDPPSRTPTPPLATAPGPRASALQKLYADAIAHILYSGCSYANFSACFPTPASKVPESLKLLHEQFTAKLGEGMRREFEAIVEEREVVRGLNGLDGLVEDARRRKGRGEGKQAPVSPHTLPPNALYQAHLQPSLMAYTDELKSRQQALEHSNAELLERVLEQRKTVEATVAGLENVVRELDASVASWQTVDEEKLRKEISEAHDGE